MTFVYVLCFNGCSTFAHVPGASLKNDHHYIIESFFECQKSSFITENPLLLIKEKSFFLEESSFIQPWKNVASSV